MPNFRKNDIYIYIYAKKDKTGSQNPTRQTRHSWRMGRQNGEGNERRCKNHDEHVPVLVLATTTTTTSLMAAAAKLQRRARGAAGAAAAGA